MVKKYSLVISIPLLWLLVFNVSSCSLINPPVVIPAYGHVDSIQYLHPGHPDYNAYITDAWVYLDDNPVGAFEMPCTFPIVASNGTHNISIYAGIKVDGAASTRTKYQLYTTYSVNVNLKQGSITNFTPSVMDASFIKLDWFENFENPGFTINPGPGTNDTMKVTTVNAYHGRSGIATLDSNASINQTYYCGISDTVTLPKDAVTPVYLEINYNCNNLFSVGFYSFTNLGAPFVVAYVYPTNGVWKKMYVSLETTLATANQLSNQYYIYFQMVRSAGVPNAYLMLDDIRLVQ